MTKLHIISLTPQHPFKRLEVVRNPAVTLSYLYSSESLFGLPFAWIIMLIWVATYLLYAPKFFNEKNEKDSDNFSAMFTFQLDNTKR